MSLKNPLILSVLFLFQAFYCYSENPSLHLVDPYFLKPNQVYTGLELENAGLKGGFLNLYELNLVYGINENILIYADFPYLTLLGANDGGCLGDVTAAVKFMIAQADNYWWRILSEVRFRFPTGVTSDQATRNINGQTLSYTPFTLGTPDLAPSLIASFLLDNLDCSLSLTYNSESGASENLFTFNQLYDYIDIELSADYLFKFSLLENVPLAFRPVIYLDYKYNISTQPVIPDGFYLTLENHWKLDNTWKLRYFLSLPLSIKNPPDNYLFSVEIGRYF